MIGLLFRCATILFGGALNVYAMLVSACKEKRVVAQLTLLSSDHIGDDRCVQMTQMRQTVRIIDRCCDVKRFHQKR
jgi:hypothetical protein